MRITPESFRTKTGKIITLRSPEVQDAKALRAMMIEVAETAPYILSTAEDFRSKPEDAEQKWIEKYEQSSRDMIILAIHEGSIVGNLDFSAFVRFKNSHRGHLGMSVAPRMRGEGIGELLLRKLFAEAPNVEGLTQIELSVMHLNVAALNLYKKVGFKECGRTPNAFKMQDGSFADQIGMYATIAL
ncbi:GNAT family N-acetyltransferase [Bdellovibrio sp. ZAP7]|uniref:GNAT family N-acetyltransferase n=1 Tax=Bdellovibrio sp. ZAP7 TaxID=2231053 RepID=UPI00115859FA|nr:GNAT family protein [Bdellovibrio sp. ZAP7]QDK45181.1 GNAT family N-acetyltransferase [Bdellovibrio sp. ZAP7]